MPLPEILEGQSLLAPEQLRRWNELAGTLDERQAAWLAGFLVGVAAKQPPAGVMTEVPPPKSLLVLFGTETGNSAGLATRLHAAARAANVPAELRSMTDVEAAELMRFTDVAAIVSTHGDGDPPDAAAELFRKLMGPRAQRLETLRYAVLALGDSSYASFCKAGADLDARLAELGARRVLDRVDCDVDFEAAAAAWIDRTVDAWKPLLAGAAAKAPVVIASAPPAPPAKPRSGSRERPVRVPVLERIQLNGRGSDRQTVHLELGVREAGIEYQPGDALGVLPENDPELVRAVIAAGGWQDDTPVKDTESPGPLFDGLARSREIAVLGRRFLVSWAERGGHEELGRRAATDGESGPYASGRSLLDVVHEYPIPGLTADELLGMLPRLKPRLYSVASSPRAHPGEAHLTVGVIRYQAHGRSRGGVCSTQVADRVADGDLVPVFIHENRRFRLPAPHVPIVMIAAGTGIAPFRGFVEEREATGAGGPSWLIFGERRSTTDFLYQVEWQRWLKQGSLTRMDVAFSRDAAEPVYVQHRMRENAARLWSWLQDGAVLYVCGSAARMARGVHDALLEIAASQGGLGREQAEAAVGQLARTGRYLRDVW